jgi:hypothetical protein
MKDSYPNELSNYQSNEPYINYDAGEEPANIENVDIVKAYTVTMASKALVALSSGICAAFISTILSKMITAKSSVYLTMALSVVFAIGSFSKGSDFGHFSRAFGVMLILLMRRASFKRAAYDLFLYSRAALSLSQRHAFPPSDNPWTYSAKDNSNLVQFNMYKCLLALMIAGSIVGSSLVKPIPLFPGWIGALLGSGFFAYTSTLKNGHGDIFRFFGFCIVSSIDNLLSTANEVDLPDKLNKISGKSFAFLSKIDSKYKVLEKLKMVIFKMVETISSMSSR